MQLVSYVTLPVISDHHQSTSTFGTPPELSCLNKAWHVGDLSICLGVYFGATAPECIGLHAVDCTTGIKGFQSIVLNFAGAELKYRIQKGFGAFYIDWVWLKALEITS